MIFLAYLLALVSVAVSALSLYRIRSVAGLMLWIPKLLAGSASAFVVGLGALAAVVGLLCGAYLAAAAGALGALLSLRYILRVAAARDGFERAFGPGWEERIAPRLRAGLLKRRYAWRIPYRRDVRWQRDLVFWTLHDPERPLLCDLWQPPQSVEPSGLALIYFHGGAWHWLDKDTGTRPLFRHLASQGHVVMDVAYRMCPETEFFGMLGDARRAIAWMKTNAQRFGVDPQRLVLAGGSAGGHLALLSAYAPAFPAFIPEDVDVLDLTVEAVIAYYSPVDLHALAQYFAANFGSLGEWAGRGVGRLYSRLAGAFLGPMPAQSSVTALGKDFSFAWLMANLLGCAPGEENATYRLASPVSYIGPANPPTLILQGEHDSLALAHISRTLYEKLDDLGAPVIYVEFPQTEHAFDLILPRCAPAAQAALYYVDRFLALLAGP
ncbi:MAG: alpha/beta hydrolase [Anaerolineales bacterium]|nr:alpha/beta hydrolase [Anaerolineales bacterium]